LVVEEAEQVSLAVEEAEQALELEDSGVQV
jgi:hypothetical protein